MTTRLREIEDSIEQLTPSEFTELARWVVEKDDERWLVQMRADTAEGRLDFLLDEARSDSEAQNWP